MHNETPDYLRFMDLSFQENIWNIVPWKVQTVLIQNQVIIDEQNIRAIYGHCKRSVVNSMYCSAIGCSLGQKASSDIILSCTVKPFKPKVWNWIKMAR